MLGPRNHPQSRRIDLGARRAARRPGHGGSFKWGGEVSPQPPADTPHTLGLR
jgi:hypothetical protein